MVTIKFECGQEDRESGQFGPYEFIQVTYGTVRVGPDGDTELANHIDGWWVTMDGQKWSDFIIGTDAAG
jgi:hypothetical protein